MKQIPEAIGSGPFKFVADERIPGSRVVFAKNHGLCPAQGRHAQLQRRPQDRECRPGGLEFHSGSGDRLGGAAAGRDRLVGKPDHRPAAADQDLQGRHPHGEGPHRRDRLPAVQPFVPAVRQCRRSAASWSPRSTRRRSWRRSPAPNRRFTRPMSACSFPARRWRAPSASRSPVARRTMPS